MLQAGNAEQFRQSFREEAREILADLETALLELNENQGDAELVGRIFRGLHTIKGSGAMFGFEGMAAFTHDLETAFDRVRAGRVETNSDLIDLTLSALDQIRVMLEEGVDGALRADEALCAGILKGVRKLAGITESAEPVMTNEPGKAGPAVPAEGMQNWRVRFAPGPELMRCGASPSLLLRELGQLGSLSVKADLDAVPPLAELDPERCYVAWEMYLKTASPIEAIRDVFIFVEDCCELKIEPEGRTVETDADPTARGLVSERQLPGGRRGYRPRVLSRRVDVGLRPADNRDGRGGSVRQLP